MNILKKSKRQVSQLLNRLENSHLTRVVKLFRHRLLNGLLRPHIPTGNTDSSCYRGMVERFDMQNRYVREAMVDGQFKLYTECMKVNLDEYPTPEAYIQKNKNCSEYLYFVGEYTFYRISREGRLDTNAIHEETTLHWAFYRSDPLRARTNA